MTLPGKQKALPAVFLGRRQVPSLQHKFSVCYTWPDLDF